MCSSWENDLAKLKIGKFCSIADNITVFLGGNHSVEWFITYPFGTINKDIFNKSIPKNSRLTRKQNHNVTIGNDVWIGGGVTIMSGIKIGDGAVIGRNSHVVNNVKPYSVVSGNPAEFLYYRFDKNTIDKLLELKWWDFDDDIINELTPYICSNDINRLIEESKKYTK